MLLWVIQMALNWLWSPVFFLEHQPDKALIIITLLLITVLLLLSRRKSTTKWLHGCLFPTRYGLDLPRS